MLILGVIIVLAIIYAGFIIGCGVGKEIDANTRGYMLCFPIVGIFALFVIVSAITPTKYGEIQLESEYEIAAINVDDCDDCYVIFNNGKYFCHLNDGTYKPLSYNIEQISSIIYINEEETPKVCEYVEECVWTWYAAPVFKDIKSYVLYIPEGSIYYGAMT